MVNLRALCQQWPPPEVALCSWGIPEGKFPGWPSSAPGGGGAGDDLDLESLNEDAKTRGKQFLDWIRNFPTWSKDKRQHEAKAFYKCIAGILPADSPYKAPFTSVIES